MYRIGIIGYGYVGKGIHRMFGDWVGAIYDPFINKESMRTAFVSGYNPQERAITEIDIGAFNLKERFQDLDLAIICVPTPSKKDGSCDTSIVEESVKWLSEVGAKLVLIKSTVEPGTTSRLQKKYPKVKIAFSPEFLGEGHYFTPFWKYPDPENVISHGFMIVGGKHKATNEIVDIFIRKMGPHTNFMQTDATTAEVIKYMENCWGAMKVTWANEMFEVCEVLGVDYREVREGWALDPRVEKMHTAVFKNARGFSGKCFPKDIYALISATKKAGYKPRLLEEIVRSNNRIRKKFGLDKV